MQIAVTKPELTRFVDEQVSAGLYATPSEVIEAGLARLMLDPVPEDLDDDAIWAIQRAEAEFDRGEDRPFREVAQELRNKYRGK